MQRARPLDRRSSSARPRNIRVAPRGGARTPHISKVRCPRGSAAFFGSAFFAAFSSSMIRATMSKAAAAAPSAHSLLQKRVGSQSPSTSSSAPRTHSWQRTPFGLTYSQRFFSTTAGASSGASNELLPRARPPPQTCGNVLAFTALACRASPAFAGTSPAFAGRRPHSPGVARGPTPQKVSHSRRDFDAVPDDARLVGLLLLVARLLPLRVVVAVRRLRARPVLLPSPVDPVRAAVAPSLGISAWHLAAGPRPGPSECPRGPRGGAATRRWKITRRRRLLDPRPVARLDATLFPRIARAAAARASRGARGGA